MYPLIINDNRLYVAEMCQGTRYQMQVYGPHSLSDDGSVISFQEQMATVSHYLHNRGTRFERTYRNAALGYMEDIYLLSQPHNLGTHVSEPAEQYTLFSEFFKIPFPPPARPKFTFIDLFAGIGGFRMALQSLGGKCVFSSEWDTQAQETYLQNYGEVPFGDITRDEVKAFVPEHFDVLCAGFPCQAFSKAGKQAGMNEARGTLFFDVAEILRRHKPKYLLLENVRNLISHDNGNTWRVITSTLHSLGYRLTEEPIMVSPHQLGIPQFRERVYILGVFDEANTSTPLNILKPTPLKKDDNSIYSVLEDCVQDPKYNITTQEEQVITAWDEFYKGIKEKVIGFPIWSAYFKDTSDISALPTWKQEFINKNRALYHNNQSFIDAWLRRWDDLRAFTPTQKKFEWQAGDSIDTLWEGVIQFRPSGVRVKKPNFFPALVAMVQTPIIGRYRRRLTIRECARLQSFPDSFLPHAADQYALKQLGNSVNINILKMLARQLLTR